MITDKQRQERSSGIFSSDVGRIMTGEGVQVTLEKMGKAEAMDLDSDPSIQLGKLLEHAVLDAYESAGNKISARSPDTLRHKEHTWLGCHLDALNGKAVVEAKTWSAFQRDLWGDPGSDELPDYIMWQTQTQMAITGLKQVDVPTCFINEKALVQLLTQKTLPIEIFIVKRSEELIDYLISEAKKVWDCVQKEELPKPVSIGDARLLYKKDDGSVIEATPEIYELCTQLKTVRSSLKNSGSSETELEEKLQAYMGEAAELRFGGKTIVTWKKAKDSDVFMKETFAEEHPDLYRQYLVTSRGSRRFLIKEKAL